MTMLKETFGREALLAFSNNYSSISAALMELIDNPFDYRRGRHLTVDVKINKAHDMVRVLDYGGEGMNAEGLADWIGWGTGHAHSNTDIGQYHVGGKLAAIYLAESVEIVCRRSGEHQVWRFSDTNWGSRATFYEGAPELLDAGQRRNLVDLPDGVGFTCVTLRNLKARRYELKLLESKLADTYRALLDQGFCTIRINDDPVSALEIPVSASFAPIEIPKTKFDGGVTVRGRIWVTDRDRLPDGRGVSLKAGIRTVFNGRTITEGEQFKHYLAGRGVLQRLFGEIEVEHLRPNTTKTDWDRDSHAWRAIEDFMHVQMSPLIAQLRERGHVRPTSREQRKRAAGVRRRIADVFKRLGAEGSAAGQVLPGETDAPGGRERPSPAKTPRKRTNGTRTRSDTQRRTEPPADAVGKLIRRYAGNVPPIEFDQLGRAGRSQWRDSERGRSIVLNTDYPMYGRIGETEDYIFESAVMHLLTEDSEAVPYTAAVEKLDEIVWLANSLN